MQKEQYCINFIRRYCIKIMFKRCFYCHSCEPPINSSSIHPFIHIMHLYC